MAGEIGAIAGQVAGEVVKAVFAKADAKKQRQLIEKISSLSLAQQKELEIRAQNISGELAKQKMVLEYLGMQKEAEEIAKIQKEKYMSIVAVGVIFVVLGIVVVKLADR